MDDQQRALSAPNPEIANSGQKIAHFSFSKAHRRANIDNSWLEGLRAIHAMAADMSINDMGLNAAQFLFGNTKMGIMSKDSIYGTGPLTRLRSPIPTPPVGNKIRTRIRRSKLFFG